MTFGQAVGLLNSFHACKSEFVFKEIFLKELISLMVIIQQQQQLVFNKFYLHSQLKTILYKINRRKRREKNITRRKVSAILIEDLIIHE